LILDLARNVANDDAIMKTPKMNGWQTQLAKGLTGATLGVVGLGRLGAAVARIGVLAWGMNFICWSENLTQQKANRKAKKIGLPSIGGALDPDGTYIQDREQGGAFSKCRRDQSSLCAEWSFSKYRQCEGAWDDEGLGSLGEYFKRTPN
jgi:hypothetical protein